jgi:hypothetical protein
MFHFNKSTYFALRFRERENAFEKAKKRKMKLKAQTKRQMIRRVFSVIKIG